MRLSIRVVREPKMAEKSEKEKKTFYFTYVKKCSCMQPIFKICGTARDLTDVINRAKFCIDCFKGFGLRKESKYGLSHHRKPLPLCTIIVYKRTWHWAKMCFFNIANLGNLPQHRWRAKKYFRIVFVSHACICRLTENVGTLGRGSTWRPSVLLILKLIIWE